MRSTLALTSSSFPSLLPHSLHYNEVNNTLTSPSTARALGNPQLATPLSSLSPSLHKHASHLTYSTYDLYVPQSLSLLHHPLKIYSYLPKPYLVRIHTGNPGAVVRKAPHEIILVAGPRQEQLIPVNSQRSLAIREAHNLTHLSRYHCTFRRGKRRRKRNISTHTHVGRTTQRSTQYHIELFIGSGLIWGFGETLICCYIYHVKTHTHTHTHYAIPPGSIIINFDNLDHSHIVQLGVAMKLCSSHQHVP